LIQPNDLRHGFLEAYRNLRSSLLYMGINGQRPRTILVTGALPGDGKSLTVANLAITLARSGPACSWLTRTCAGTLHKLFGLSEDSGLHEVLSQEADPAKAIIATAVPNLFLLPRGAALDDPGELFLSPQMDRLIDESAGKFDYVIFDSAPVMAADDVTTLAPRVKGSYSSSAPTALPPASPVPRWELLYQRKVNILGLVFNAVDVRGAEYYYYKYKDYYAHRPGARKG